MSQKKLPSLLIFPREENPDSTGLIFSLREKKGFSVGFLKHSGDDSGDIHCYGSSYGWLMMLKQKGNLYLLNPFLGFEIQLPILRYSCDFRLQSYDFVTKSLLTCDPFEKKRDCRVVVIYGEKSRIGYYKLGDFDSWVDLECKHKNYCDIIYQNQLLFALCSDGTIEVWDFQRHFIKQFVDIEFPYPKKLVETKESLNDLYATKHYLVESGKHLLLVVRFIGEFVGPYDVPLYLEDAPIAYDTHPMVCPYKTLFFHVYRLDCNLENWIEVESLGDEALFVGGSESMSVSVGDCAACRGNSIYFTDDYWGRMDEDNMYGGHDMGVFSLADQSVKPIYDCEIEQMLPPPIWVVPN